MNRQLCLTEDGSYTLFNSDIQQHYHSIHGAIGESLHVFIYTGLIPLLDQCSPLRILEIGLGTGLNALLTEVFTRSHPMVYYSAIEAFPLIHEEIVPLNYQEVFPEISNELLLKIHNIPSDNHYYRIRENFYCKVFHTTLQQFKFENDVYDLVYFDAFAPDVQPELWEKELFLKIFRAMKKGGVLCTYSAKGIVRRRMQEVGFSMERLPGFSGKREMLKATK